MDLTNIRIKEHFGLVTNDTKTGQFSFLVSPPKNRESIEKGDMICLDHPVYGDACQVLAEVKEITSYEEVAGSTIGDRIGKLLATAEIIGYIDLRNESQTFRNLRVPPNPGSRIYRPYANFLEDILNRGIDGKPYAQPLHLGTAEITGASPEGTDQQTNFCLDANDLTRKNTLISALDGAGKTHTSTVIIEELSTKSSFPIVIFDSTNEYTTIGTSATPDKNYPFAYQIAVMDASNIKNTQDPIAIKIKQSQVTIINAEDLTLAEKNDCYGRILETLAKSRREKVNKPFLLVIEDAENLTLQPIQELLASKNGIATVLITSHPSLLGGKILSKMQTQIIGKTTDPQDLAYLRNMINGNDEQILSLDVGEWIINSMNINRPIKISVRERHSRAK